MSNQVESRPLREIIEGRIDPGVPDSIRNTEQYTFKLNFSTERELLEYIHGKTVLDAGSGRGGLAKSVVFHGEDKHRTRIIPLNPRLAIRRFREDEQYFTSTLFQWPPYPSRATLSNQEIKQMQEYHDRRALAGFVGQLPLRDESVDIVLDCQAIFFHRRRTQEHWREFERGYGEFFRVLKIGGTVRADKSRLSNPADPRGLLSGEDRGIFRSIGFKEIKDIRSAFELTKKSKLK